MKKIRSSLAAISLLLASSTALPQDIDLLGPPLDAQNRSSSISGGEDTPIRLDPSETQVRFGQGNAPLHAVLATYANYLNSAYRAGRDSVLRLEASALEVSETVVEQITISLNRYSDFQKEDWINKQTDFCLPVLRGQDISDAYAKAAIAQLDNDEGIRNAIAQTVLGDLQEDIAEDQFNRLLARLGEFGRSVDYSRTNLVRHIELLPDTSFKEYFIGQCEAL